MHLQVTQPDGSITLTDGRDFTCAKIWAEFNSDLKWLISVLESIPPGGQLEYEGRIWKRIT